MALPRSEESVDRASCVESVGKGRMESQELEFDMVTCDRGEGNYRNPIQQVVAKGFHRGVL